MAGIVVVGAGVSGLVCAWRLKRAGHDVEVLEQSQAIGGRLRAEPHGDYRVQAGASFVTDGQRNVVSVANALGLGARRLELEPGGSVPGAVLYGGKLEPCTLAPGLAALRSHLLPAGSRLRLGWLAAEVFRRRDRLDPVQPERAARLENGERMPGFAARIAGEAARDRLLAPICSALYGCEPEDMSSAFFLLCLRSLGLGAAPITFEGGLATLSEELARTVAVRTGCEVFSVETARGGARVRYRGNGRERSFLADAVVMAVPGPVVPQLCADLTGDERSFFGSVTYAPGIQVDFLLDRPPRGLPFGIAFARSEGTGLRALFQSHREVGAAPPGAGLLTAHLGDEPIRRLAQAKDEEIAGWTLDALARTALGRLEPHHSVVHRWAHARPIFPRGALSRLEHFQVRIDRSPRLAFAGDYLIGPTVEGALTSGMQAASRVVQSLDDTGLSSIQSRLCHEP